MNRLLIIPAAGRGSRLGWNGPKALCPVAGQPMVDHLIRRYTPFVAHIAVVAAPAAQAQFRRQLAGHDVPITIVVQAAPNGMLPAILTAQPLVAAQAPDQVWITWCDQIGISASTVSRLAGECNAHPDASLVFPTVAQTPPYIHFVRDSGGRIARVLHRREGDVMPETGESDTGVFALRGQTYLTDLMEYDAVVATAGDGTGERNFLPFIPWLAARRSVLTFRLTDPREAIGVNTPEELALMEEYLRERA